MQPRSPLQQFIDGRTAPEFVTDSVLPFQAIIKQEGAERHAAYNADLESAGIIEDLHAFKKQDKARAQTRLMSDKAADRMERLGKGGYHTGQAVSFVGLNSESVEELPPYRRNNSIPYVAQQKRSNMLKELMAYVEEQEALRGVHCRMWVIHNGPRCQSIHLRERWKEQNSLVTNWNESKFAKDNQAFVFFRSNEAGSPVKKAHEKTRDPKTGKWERRYLLDAQNNRIRCTDSNGCQTWHPHTHLLIRFGRFFKTKDEFTNVIKRASAHFGTPKLDAGRIENAREACKYVVKGDELNNVRDIDFLRFLKWTFKRRLVETYGELKQRIRDHKANGQKIKSTYCPKKGKCVYKLDKNYNANLIRKKAQKQEGDEAMKTELELNRFEERHAKFEAYKEMHGEAAAQAAKGLFKMDEESFAIVAKLAPMAYFGPIKEALLMVRGRVDMDELRERPEIMEVLMRTQPQFDNACQLFEALHGVTPSEWMQGKTATVEDLKRGANGVLIAEKSSVSLGSAHNPPVISIRDSSKAAKGVPCVSGAERTTRRAAQAVARSSPEPEQFNFSAGVTGST